MTLNSQEQQRIKRLNEHMAGLLSIKQVAELMQVSERQVYRWKASYREKGVEAMAHKNRGKANPRRIPDPMREHIVQQAKGVYAGCNQHHLRDLLEEREGVMISRSSLRRILEEASILTPIPAPKLKHRLRRPRYRQEGQLVQIDASPHAWLQERGPRLSLVGGIDDATGKVVGAIFREHEDQHGYFQVIQQMVERYGRPLALYHDRHTMFPASDHHASQHESVEEQLRGTKTPTQLGRLFTQLRMTSIAARSPQAKGRIERLWGTFQNRLVSELRLAKACTLEEANAVLQEYLPRFNARFAIAAAESTVAWQAWPDELSSQDCFCLQEQRSVSNDNTISYKGQRIQLLPDEQRRSWARCKVMVHEQFDGSRRIVYQGQSVPSRQAPPDPIHHRHQEPPQPSAAVEKTKAQPKKGHTPPANHPWRKRAVVSSRQ
ncbi:transposase [Dictyobacter alpinus]|uniref:Transposase n=1 Tax=Dictyobacter alpinus TaxID=2014873 RepID=A0A402B879_9CHLR|nr:ISNCY family transposase [Dictyobacter alpinus]GCE27500.1 transposase [Dictyobacter alpinus]